MDFEKSVEEAPEKEISYIDSQLNDYIDKLNSKDKFNYVAKPNIIDDEKWNKYLKHVKCYSDEMKRRGEWIFVSTLFDQVSFVFQHFKNNRKDLNENAQRKNIKETLEKSISSNSDTQKNRYKQVYDHIVDLVKLFDSHEIPIDVWILELSKICITFRFLHESNFKRKKNNDLYDEFIQLLISNCQESLKNSKSLVVGSKQL
ncbi:4398_t:CDS:1 [Gigaspora margarita]|uniref:4398_t:CDS:1 n=1 Tax=Gigaspora margarita TaxID=4874 RepID=A0ABN7WTW7_GIGMA|nr:4398_t:CDS:1 [Gigaspora margarita]